MEDIESGLIDIIIVYKVDRLSRSLADFARMIESFDYSSVSFMSITQQFNTSTSMGRLTLNVLLSFAQFEREVTGERIRDKIEASKKKGMWMGGAIPPGYDVIDRSLVVNEKEAETVRSIFMLYCKLESVKTLKEELDQLLILKKPTKRFPSERPYSRGGLYTLLKNPLYLGKIRHKEKIYPGRHSAIVDKVLWNRAQKILSKNQHEKYLRTRAKEPSLLAGLVFDEEGHPFSPTHTRRNSRRYRYYVNQVKVQFKKANPEALLRVPAHSVESVVESKVIKLLSKPDQISKALQTFNLSGPEQEFILDNAHAISSEWKTMQSQNKIELFSSIFQKIVLKRTEILLQLSLSGLLTILLPDHQADNKGDNSKCLKIRIPVELKRCGVETKLIITQPAPEQSLTPHVGSRRAIQKALKTAVIWNSLLLSGVFESTSEIAERYNLSQRYISQILKLAYISPEIIKKILSGDIPYCLTLGKFKQNIPICWDAQKDLYF